MSISLRDLDYQFKIEFRSAYGRNEELPRLAAELVNLKPDLILALGSPSALALKQATASIPIVIVSGDPVGYGLVDSLAHPGGNLTGRSDNSAEIGPLRLQLLAETLPGTCCFILLRNPSNPGNVSTASSSSSPDVLKSLGLERKIIEAATPDQLDQVLAGPIEDRFKALVVSADNMFISHRVQIAKAALRLGLPAFGPYPADAEAGFLMGYGVSGDEEARAVAGYIDKILKGAKPADLPVEQPTHYNLVINLKTAKALGITIPQIVFARANEVIE